MKQSKLIKHLEKQPEDLVGETIIITNTSNWLWSINSNQLWKEGKVQFRTDRGSRENHFYALPKTRWLVVEANTEWENCRWLRLADFENPLNTARIDWKQLQKSGRILG